MFNDGPDAVAAAVLGGHLGMPLETPEQYKGEINASEAPPRTLARARFMRDYLPELPQMQDEVT